MPVSGHPELEVLVGADLGQRTQLEPVVFGRQFKLQVFGGFGGIPQPEGYGRDETIAKALESGTADYIVKPFSPTELVARVQAALRARAVPETFVHGELAIDYGRRHVSVAGREVPLTATEFDLLRILSLNGGRVVTTEALLRQVWGRRGSDDTDRVRTVVKKLRHKLGDAAAKPTYVFNEHGVGYRFARPGPA